MKRAPAFLALVLVLSACGLSPEAPCPSPRRASFDGAFPDSGVRAVLRDETGRPAGWVVTPRARARYNALIAKYGSLWTPPLFPDEGVRELADGLFLMTNEAMEKFVVMSQYANAE